MPALTGREHHPRCDVRSPKSKRADAGFAFRLEINMSKKTSASQGERGKGSRGVTEPP